MQRVESASCSEGANAGNKKNVWTKINKTAMKFKMAFCGPWFTKYIPKLVFFCLQSCTDACYGHVRLCFFAVPISGTIRLVKTIGSQVVFFPLVMLYW